MLLKPKDLFTVATIAIGFVVIPLAADGRLALASWMIIVGTVCDLADGAVARITRTANRFGAEFDTVGDLVIFSVAPSALIYFSLAPIDRVWAAVIGALPLIFGSIRLARFNVKRVEYPGYWMGLTRPGAAGVIVSWLNSSVYRGLDPLLPTALVVVTVSLLNVSMIPYIGHHKRQMTPLLRGIMAAILLGLVVTPWLGLFWDFTFALSIVYLLSPLWIPAEERGRIRTFLQGWRDEERALG